MVDTVFVVTVVGTGMGILIGIGGLILTLFLWTRGEGNADRRAMAQEMKAFQERMEQHEVDFKAFMKQEEQKRTKILMGK